MIIMWTIASIVGALGLLNIGLIIFILFFNGFDRMIEWSFKIWK